MDHVDVLLALPRKGDRTRTADAVASETHLTPETVQRVLDVLVSTQAVSREDDGYRLRRDDSAPHAIDELLLMYNTRPVALVRAIYSRHSPIQSFADAFKIRRKDES